MVCSQRFGEWLWERWIAGSRRGVGRLGGLCDSVRAGGGVEGRVRERREGERGGEGEGRGERERRERHGRGRRGKGKI